MDSETLKMGFFILFPKYDHSLQKIIRFKYEKMLITSVVTLYLSITSLLTYFRYTLVYPQFPTTQIVLELAMTFVNQLMCILTLTSLIYYDQMWLDYFKNIDLLQKILKLKFQFYNHKLMILTITSKLLMFMIIAVFYKILYGKLIFILYIDVLLSSIYDMVCAFLIVNVIKFVSQCLKQTRIVLEQTVSNNNLNNVSANIKNISLLYDNIKSLNKSFELIFGWRILLLSINAGIMILGSLNALIFKVSLNLEQLIIDAASIIIGILSVVRFNIKFSIVW